MLIIDFAVLLIVGYRSLCSKRRNHAVYAVYVAHMTAEKKFSFVVLFT